MPAAKKKAAKKAAKRKSERAAKDLRRLWEHTGRVEILRHALTKNAAEVVTSLIAMASAELESGRSREAADLLRASEHLSFAALAGGVKEDRAISVDLRVEIGEQFEELNNRADDHWDEDRRSGLLSTIYRNAREDAVQAFRAGAWHQAIELARAAEALAHVREPDMHRLTEGKKSLRLKAA